MSFPVLVQMSIRSRMWTSGLEKYSLRRILVNVGLVSNWSCAPVTHWVTHETFSQPNVLLYTFDILQTDTRPEPWRFFEMRATCMAIRRVLKDESAMVKKTSADSSISRIKNSSRLILSRKRWELIFNEKNPFMNSFYREYCRRAEQPAAKIVLTSRAWRKTVWRCILNNGMRRVFRDWIYCNK